MKVAGIDYGSKLAGTTAIAWVEGEHLCIARSLKNKDADAFLKGKIGELGFQVLGIDAPLSLPAVYKGEETNEYFYRACDKELKAMSPMFLGGLTARAMKLKAGLEKQGVKVLEVYPAATANRLELKQFNYKKKSAHYDGMLAKVQPMLSFKTFDMPQNSHEMDAVLALLTVTLAIDNRAQSAGKETEGLIFF